jgi:hypothetical protein
MCDRRTDMYLSKINYIKHVTDIKKKCVGLFLVKIFGKERASDEMKI